MNCQIQRNDSLLLGGKKKAVSAPLATDYIFKELFIDPSPKKESEISVPDLNPNEIHCKILTEFIGKSIKLHFYFVKSEIPEHALHKLLG